MASALRTFAEFDSDIPDETVEDEHDIVVYGGKGVAEAIMELLKAPTRQVSTLEDLNFKGWEFTVRTTRRRFVFRVQYIEQVLLSSFDDTLPSIFGKPNQADHAALLTGLDALMQRDGRFHNIRWCNENEIFGEGSGTPTPLG
jgi:hypothetical protein